MRGIHTALLALLAACQVISGIDDYVAIAPAGTGGAAGSTSPCTGVCMAIPDGWDGPMILSGDPSLEPPECPGDFEGGSTVFDESHLGGPAECTCECLRPMAPDVCLSAGVSIGCTGPTLLNAGECANTGVSGGTSVSWSPPEPLPVNCSAGSHQTVLPPVPAVRRCEGADHSGCPGDERCLGEVAASFTGWCIQRKDVVEDCPPGFPDRHVLWEDANEARFCAPCTCGAFVTDEDGCGGNVTAHAQDNCGDAGMSLTMSCGTVTGNPIYLAWTPSVNGSCTVSEGVPDGEVELGGPLTICCTED